MITVITGSEGFLGRRVVDRLASAGHSVIAVDRIEHTGPSIDGVVYHISDLSDPTSLIPCPLAPFTLVHLAWDMRRQLGYATQAEQVGPFAGVLEHWSERGLRRVVAMGSAEEYGGRNGVIRESDPPVLPLSPYGWAKRAAHDFAASWQVRTGIPVVWLRPFIIYGPGQRGDMMIPYAVQCAREGRTAEFTDGKQKRDFIFIDDVVDGLARAVEADVDGFHACNLGRGESVTVRDILTAIADHFDVGQRFNFGARSRRPGEPDIQTADTTRARELLGWRAAVDWREGLTRTLQE